MSLENIAWQWLIILSAGLTSISQIVNKLQTAKASALQTRGYYYFFAAIVVGIFWWFTSGQIPINWWLYGLYGMVIAALTVIYSMAQRISMSQTSLAEPVGQLLGMVAAAIILSEWRLLTTNQGPKIALAMILMPLFFWLFYHKSVDGKKWLKLSLVYVLALAVFKVAVKVLLDGVGAAAELLFFQYLGSLAMAVVGIKIKRQPLLISKRFAIKAMFQGFFGGSSILLFYTAVKLTTVTQTTLLRAPLILIIASVSGLVGFKEIQQMTTKKWLGVAVGLVILLLVVTTNY